MRDRIGGQRLGCAFLDSLHQMSFDHLKGDKAMTDNTDKLGSDGMDALEKKFATSSELQS